MGGRVVESLASVQARLSLSRGLGHNDLEMADRPLTRSKSDKVLLGVCGGIARWLGWDSTRVRVAYVLVSVCSAAFPGILVYLILAVVMPRGE